MPLYIVGIAIAIGFALLLWRQHKSGVGWQREVSFLVDLVALSATALVVGVLVVAQLGPGEEDTSELSPNEENTPIAISTKAIENEPVVATQTEVLAESETDAVVAIQTEIIAESETDAVIATQTETISVAESGPESAVAITASVTPEPKLTATTVDIESEVTPTATSTAKSDPTVEAKITATSTLIPKPTIEPTPEVTTYIVRSGDVFGVIAQNAGLSYEELQVANPDVIPERIKIGDELIIPPAVEEEIEEDAEEEANAEDETSTPTPASEQNQYFVRDGDTFSTIAQRFGLTVSELSEYNPGINSDRISVGDRIYIP